MLLGGVRTPVWSPFVVRGDVVLLVIVGEDDVPQVGRFVIERGAERRPLIACVARATDRLVQQPLTSRSVRGRSGSSCQDAQSLQFLDSQ